MASSTPARPARECDSARRRAAGTRTRRSVRTGPETRAAGRIRLGGGLRWLDRGKGGGIGPSARRDETVAHVGRDEVEDRHRGQTEHQLDRLDHAWLTVKG